MAIMIKFREYDRQETPVKFNTTDDIIARHVTLVKQCNSLLARF